jgi:hypothetical protein
MYLAKAAAVLKALFSPCGNLASGKVDSSLMENPLRPRSRSRTGEYAAVTEASSRIEALPEIAGLGNPLSPEKQLRNN